MSDDDTDDEEGSGSDSETEHEGDPGPVRQPKAIAVPDEEDEALGEVATSPAGVAGVEGAEQEGELDDRASQLMQGLGISTPRPAPEGEEASAGGSPKVADPPAEGTDIAMEGAS